MRDDDEFRAATGGALNHGVDGDGLLGEKRRDPGKDARLVGDIDPKVKGGFDGSDW